MSSFWGRWEYNPRKILYSAFLLVPIAYFVNIYAQSDDLISKALVGFGLIYLLFRTIENKNIRIELWFFVSFLLTVLWGLFANSVPVSDFAFYRGDALSLASGDASSLLRTLSLGTILYYAAFSRVLGEDMISFYMASALAWSLGTYLIYLSLTHYIPLKQSKVWALVSFLSPVYIIYGPVVSSESVLYLIISMGFFLFTKYRLKNPHLSHFLLGIFLGMAFLTRPTSMIFLISVLIVVMGLHFCIMQPKAEKEFTQEKIILKARLASIVLAAFLIPVLLYGSLSYARQGEFRVFTNIWGSANLLFGTNRESSGGWNMSDAAMLSDENKTHEEVMEGVNNFAISRILEDKTGFLAFALTKKVERLWKSQDFAYFWNTAESPKLDYLESTVASTMKKLLDYFYAGFLLCFILWLCSGFFRESAEKIFVLTPIYGFALLHIFLVVQGRYHLFVYPFILFGAATFLTRAGCRRNSVYKA